MAKASQDRQSRSSGKVLDGQEVDETFPLKLTESCVLSIINDLSSDNVIAYTGEFIMVNGSETKLGAQFSVPESLRLKESGELAALVSDWTEDSTEVYARRQLATDTWSSCSGPVESFVESEVCPCENHLLQELQANAFTGFMTTSLDWKTPFVSIWFSSRRKDANHQNFKWDPKLDPRMVQYKSIYLETLPSAISRFDIIESSSESMFELKFITEAERVIVDSADDPKLRSFEFLVLQYLPEPGVANWNHVAVVFVSNWRHVLAKTIQEDFSSFLQANLWYLDRSDFEDQLFRMAASVHVMTHVEELIGALRLHEILVMLHVIIFLSFADQYVFGVCLWGRGWGCVWIDGLKYWVCVSA